MAADDLISPLRAVCVLDPAIDRVLTPIDRYAETREPELVRELPGHRARWAMLEPLSVGDFMIVDGYPTAPMKLRRAFVYACRLIENFERPGEPLHPTRMVVNPEDGRERAVWTPEEEAAIFRRLGADFVYELGGLAYERATAGNFWGGSVSYTLPQSSVDGLARIARLLAARERALVGIQSSERSAAP